MKSSSSWSRGFSHTGNPESYTFHPKNTHHAHIYDACRRDRHYVAGCSLAQCLFTCAVIWSYHTVLLNTSFLLSNYTLLQLLQKRLGRSKHALPVRLQDLCLL
jgi:hypothetical protein